MGEYEGRVVVRVDPTGFLGDDSEVTICDDKHEAWRFLLDRGFAPKLTMYEDQTQLFWHPDHGAEVAWIFPVREEE